MYGIKKGFFLKGEVVFENGPVSFKYKNINASRLAAVRSGSFMTFKASEFIETDRYINNLNNHHKIKLQDGRELYIQTIEPIEDNKKNMYKKNAYTGMLIALA